VVVVIVVYECVVVVVIVVVAYECVYVCNLNNTFMCSHQHTQLSNAALVSDLV
jgi:hypothetical protein